MNSNPSTGYWEEMFLNRTYQNTKKTEKRSAMVRFKGTIVSYSPNFCLSNICVIDIVEWMMMVSMKAAISMKSSMTRCLKFWQNF